MMIKRLKIERLFDQFDYDIALKDEGLTILTGPNGYGKTTILRLLKAIGDGNVFFFLNLLFHRVELEFVSGHRALILREGSSVKVGINGKKTVTLTNEKIEEKVFKNIKRSDYRKLDDGRWVDDDSGTVLTSEEIFEENLPNINSVIDEFVDLREGLADVYMIRAQRLLTKRRLKDLNRISFWERTDSFQAFSDSISEYDRELKGVINRTLADSSKITQELDSSFPRRLFDQKEGIAESDFNERFEKIKTKQRALGKYGLSVIQEDNHPMYLEENAKALRVYLDDSEKKLEIFSGLLGKLEAFANILNEHRFANKKVKVSGSDGITFFTNDSKKLALSALSSGEQQEVVLLYELLFKVKPGSLVLIDEPEISLHVAWQKEFLKDMFRLIELQKINILAATHSPQIINNRWDLTVDLEEISR